jgi:hypothetical protein
VPVIASRVGAEGLHLVPGTHFIETDEDAMATALVAAMRNPEPIRKMTEAGRSLVREQYDWSALARKLEGVWESACISPVGGVSDPSPSARGKVPRGLSARNGSETHPTAEVVP